MENSIYMRTIWTVIAIALCVIALRGMPFISSVNAQTDQVIRMTLCNMDGTACADIVRKRFDPTGQSGNYDSYNAIGMHFN